MNKKIKIVLISVIIMIIGIVISSYGIISEENHKEKQKGYIKTTAKVIDTIATSQIKKDKATGLVSNYYLYAPIIKYKISNKTYKYESKEYDVKEPKIGSKIEIAYQKKNPNNIKFVKKNNDILIIIIGTIITFIGIVLLITRKKK